MPEKAETKSVCESEKSRFNNYDVLRIISTIAVIVIHVNWHFFGSRARTPMLDANFLVESILNIVTRFSVPAFVMISGAFNLRKETNGNIIIFYKKSIWKIFLPSALAIALFFSYDITKAIVFKRNILSSVMEIVYGDYYNLWFIYMLAGLYLLTPFIVKLKENLNSNTYIIASFSLLLWAVISQAVSSQKVAYAIGVVFAFLGYYLAGDIILNYIDLRHKSISYYAIAGIMFALAFIARFLGATYYLSAAYTNFFSPFITVASLCIFAAVKQSRVQKDWSWLSGKTFYLYIFHTIVYSSIFKILRFLGIAGLEPVQIIIVSGLTFFVSLVLSVFYDKFWSSRIAWKKKYDALTIWEKA